ncbi:MAG: tripartite tricarboxylate transporter TctB family protein [Deltaproteobacteria bacterium]|nr:tripartite tricarboxylate transporter TctB family protein [Deltaproteobacteria bacterium]
MKRFFLSDLLAGLLFSLLGFYILFEIAYFPVDEGNIPGPRYWPRLIALGLILFGLWLAGSKIYSRRMTAIKPNLHHPHQRQVLTILVMTIFYILLWSLFGFFIPTVLFLLGTMFVLFPFQPKQKVRGSIRISIYSLLIALFVYGSFYLGLHVPLN